MWDTIYSFGGKMLKFSLNVVILVLKWKHCMYPATALKSQNSPWEILVIEQILFSLDVLLKKKGSNYWPWDFKVLQTRDQSDEHSKNSELINWVQNIQSPDIVSPLKPCIVKNKIFKYNLLTMVVLCVSITNSLVKENKRD